MVFGVERSLLIARQVNLKVVAQNYNPSNLSLACSLTLCPTLSSCNNKEYCENIPYDKVPMVILTALALNVVCETVIMLEYMGVLGCCRH
jgi:hypothetical protein